MKTLLLIALSLAAPTAFAASEPTCQVKSRAQEGCPGFHGCPSKPIEGSQKKISEAKKSEYFSTLTWENDQLSYEVVFWSENTIDLRLKQKSNGAGAWTRLENNVTEGRTVMLEDSANEVEYHLSCGL